MAKLRLEGAGGGERDREIAALFDQLMGITALSYQYGTNGLSPDVAPLRPSNGHGVRTIPGHQESSVADLGCGFIK